MIIWKLCDLAAKVDDEDMSKELFHSSQSHLTTEIMEVITATSGIASLLSFGLQVTGGLFDLHNTSRTLRAI